MVSIDKIQHVRSRSECLPSECRREENISCKALGLWFSVAVSKLGKTNLMFVQPGAKLNSVYYCENVLEQGLLPAVRRISNNDFVLKEDGAPCTPFTCCIPAFQCAWVHWTRKLAAKQSRSKSGGLFSVDSIVVDGVTSQKISHLISWSTPGLS